MVAQVESRDKLQEMNPASDGEVWTPDDATDLPCPTSGIYIGNTGAGANLTVTMARGNQIQFSNVQVGIVYPIRATRIWATGTTASDIVALYP